MEYNKVLFSNAYFGKFWFISPCFGTKRRADYDIKKKNSKERPISKDRTSYRFGLDKKKIKLIKKTLSLILLELMS